MTFIFYIYELLKGFLKRLREDHVSAYASQAALFMLMAFIPLLMLILNLIRYTPVSEEFLMEMLSNALPVSFHELAKGIITDLYQSSNGTILSLSIVFTIWSASRGILSLIRGFNSIYHIKEERNYILLRLASSLYTIIMVIGIVLMLTLMVFGNTLLGVIHRHFPLIYDAAAWLIQMRILYAPIIMTIIFVFLYHLVPNGHRSVLSFLPGALFSSVGWMLFSYFYSFYVEHFAAKSYSYGSLTILVLLMLWVYICMYIIFIGAEINMYFHTHFKFLAWKIRKS